MAMNPLPPQAYTKETLQKAYQWLLTQNTSIKEMASNQDILISLYLKAQRNGDASLEAPSIQNFKQELKSLANMMGDFQSPAMTQPSVQPTNGITTNVAPTPSLANGKNTAHTTPGPMPMGIFSDLDQHSWLLIQEVRMVLNLGSDTEALRALISLGYRQFKKINN